MFQSAMTRERDRLTAEAMADLQPGMQFHEMYSSWVIVLAVEPDGGRVISLAVSGPGQVPGIGRVELHDDAIDFRASYSYRSMPGYSVDIHPARPNVEGWLEHYPRAKWIDRSAKRREMAAHLDRMKSRRLARCETCGQVKP